jgi:GNAT superfamily N-acetyltransferase
MFMWKIKDLKKASKKEYRTLVASTPLGDDYMREGVIKSKDRIKNSYIAICLYDKKQLIGWSMLDLFLSKGSKHTRTYIYVKKKFRRKKYGTKILEKAKKVNLDMGYRGIKVCPHNKESKKFFKNINIQKEEVVRGYKS